MAASREEVFERVKEVLSEQLGVEENDVTEEANFQEDLDALGTHMNLGSKCCRFTVLRTAVGSTRKPLAEAL